MDGDELRRPSGCTRFWRSMAHRVAFLEGFAVDVRQGFGPTGGSHWRMMDIMLLQAAPEHIWPDNDPDMTGRLSRRSY
jgi:hypothetical protein